MYLLALGLWINFYLLDVDCVCASIRNSKKTVNVCIGRGIGILVHQLPVLRNWTSCSTQYMFQNPEYRYPYEGNLILIRLPSYLLRYKLKTRELSKRNAYKYVDGFFCWYTVVFRVLVDAEEEVIHTAHYGE